MRLCERRPLAVATVCLALVVAPRPCPAEPSVVAEPAGEPTITESTGVPWPGVALLSVSAWQAEFNVPVSEGASLTPGAGARASFGAEGIRPLGGLGAMAALSYRWLGDGSDSVLARAGVALELSYRAPVAGLLSLRPALELGASYGFGQAGSGGWGLDVAAGVGLAVRLGGREYLTLSPAVRWAPVGDGTASFALAIGSRTETAWRMPVPEAGPRIESVPALYSPDGDGRDDDFNVRLRFRNARAVEAWSLEVRDSSGAAFARREGAGRPPAAFAWDGLSDDGRLVDPAADYSLTLSTRDVLGRTAEAEARFIVDILVIKVGDRYKVRVPPIVFPSNSADLGAVGAEWMVKANQSTLERLIMLFSRFPEYSIVVEGHANAVRWSDPAALAAEQRDELEPLSLSRAEAVRAALVALGIAPARIRSSGLGGSEPLVPFSNEAESWRNRRVEFLLIKKD